MLLASAAQFNQELMLLRDRKSSLLSSPSVGQQAITGSEEEREVWSRKENDVQNDDCIGLY